MSVASVNKIDILRDRAEMLAKARRFFAERAVLEVDVPSLSIGAPIDPYIDLVTAHCMGKRCYLHSSPEYGMKRLLAMGVGDCYQLSHVFRDGELGERHQPEFTMVEWYHLGGTFEELIQETLEFVTLFLGPQQTQIFEYEEVFWKFIGRFPETIDERDFCFAQSIEPQLQPLTVVKNYPPEQAMLAKTILIDGMALAQRFELFFKGVELANGYDELADLTELRQRLILNNDKRLQMGKQRYPLDEAFLTSSIPDCCGVAVGFDRLMALRHEVEDIKEILPLSWNG